MTTDLNTADPGAWDKSLISLAVAGNQAGYAALFETYKSGVYRLCLRMTNDRYKAEDFTQQTFLHVFRKLAMWRGKTEFATWLYQVAAATVLSAQQRARAPEAGDPLKDAGIAQSAEIMTACVEIPQSANASA